MRKLLFLAITFTVLGQANAQKLHTYFLDSEALLGRSEANCVLIDAHRVIWIGTPKGLIKFDSYQSHWIENALLRSSSIYDIVESEHGNIFVASSSGLWQIDDQGKVEHLFADPVNKIYPDGQSVIILSHSMGISRYHNTKLSPLLSIPQIQYHDILFKNDSLLVATSAGLYVMLEDQQQILSKEEFLQLEMFDDKVYLLKENGLKTLDGNDFKEVAKWNDFKAIDLAIDPSGTYWLATGNGQLVNFDNLSFRKYSKENNISLTKTNSLFFDKEGMLWLSGVPGVLGINISLPFTYFDYETGLASRSVSGVAFAANQIISYSNDSKTISRIDKNRQIKKIETPVNAGVEFVFSTNQSIYLVDNANVLWSYEGGRFTNVNQFKSPVTYTFENKRDGFVLLENGQLFKTSANAVSLIGNYNIPEKIQKASFSNGSLCVLDTEGSLMFFTSSGDKEQLKLPGTDLQINDFYKNQGDTLYLATNKGIAIYSSTFSDTVRFIGTRQGLNNENINMVYQDSDRQIWAQTNLGLTRVALDDNQDELLINSITNYSKNDGLLSHYFVDLAEDSLKGIWWASSTGLTLFDPLNDLPNLQKPGIKVGSIKILKGNAVDSLPFDYNFAGYADTILLKNSHLIEIKAQAATYNRAHSSQVLYKLRESDDWVQVPSEQSIILEGLSVGKFNIQLKSKNSFGVESDDVVTVNLEVLGPIWQQKWVYAVAVALLFGFGFVLRRTLNSVRDGRSRDLQVKLSKELEEVERKSHQQILKTERLKQLNELIRAQKEEMELKNKEIEGQKYELALTNNQIKKQKDLILETGNKLKASINYAQRIQGALMTTEVEIKENIDQSFVMFRPRDVVSGDFFWFKKLKDKTDGRELMVIAAVDCTGHGVPGAIMSVVGMNLLNSTVNIKGITDPGLILTELNIDIRSMLRHDTTNVNDGMDMAICVIDPANKKVSYAGAKNPIFYIENNEVQIIKADKNPIGGQQSEARRTYTTVDIPLLEKERMFYLFSDGYQDQFGGEKGYKFLSKNFRELLLSISDKHIFEQKTILEETFSNWKGDLHQTDDVLVIGFRI